MTAFRHPLWFAAAAVFLTGCPARQSETPQPGAAAPAPAGPERMTTKTGAEMVLLPAGEFTMGDPAGEDDEKPAHQVRLAKFWIDTTEVTQASFERLMGKNPARWTGPERPVERVTWYAAIQYCNMRSMREGLKPCYDAASGKCDFTADGYRLPTEAEWEYACRAGTATPWSCGADASQLAKAAWTKENAGKGTHPVKQKQPNAWGLCDMHGNVAEWCHDFYGEKYPAGAADGPHGPDSGEQRVLRGGSWATAAETCRSAARRPENPAFADACFGSDTFGFRCVRRAK
jgi:formylglycine-generating enzyme required for sulfatase activity